MTQRLVAWVAQYWARFDGWCASRGVDPLELRIDRFLNLAYFWMVQNQTQEDNDKFEAMLWRPPVGVEVTQGPWSAEAEQAALHQFMSDFESLGRGEDLDESVSTG